MGPWHLEAFIRKSWPEKLINLFYTVTVLKNTVEGLSEPFLTQPKPIPPQVDSERHPLL